MSDKMDLFREDRELGGPDDGTSLDPIKFKTKSDAALFKVGESMWSPDGGKTWQRGERPWSKIVGLDDWLKPWVDCPCGSKGHQRAGHPIFVVIKVDRQRGSITIKAKP